MENSTKTIKAKTKDDVRSILMDEHVSMEAFNHMTAMMDKWGKVKAAFGTFTVARFAERLEALVKMNLYPELNDDFQTIVDSLKDDQPIEVVDIKRECEVRDENRAFIVQFKHEDENQWGFALTVQTMYLSTIEDCEKSIQRMKADHTNDHIGMEYRIARIVDSRSFKQRIMSMKHWQFVKVIIDAIGTIDPKHIDNSTFGTTNNHDEPVACLTTHAFFIIAGIEFNEDNIHDTRRAKTFDVDVKWLNELEDAVDAFTMGDVEKYATGMIDLGIADDFDESIIHGMHVPKIDNKNWRDALTFDSLMEVMESLKTVNH